MWEFTQDVDGKNLDPRGVCCDLDGRIYVDDGGNKRLIMFDGKMGVLMQLLLTDEKAGWINNVIWTDTPPEFTVVRAILFDFVNISTYNVTEL